MTILAIYSEKGGNPAEVINDDELIAARLEPLNVRFERWEATQDLGDAPSQEQVLAAYRNDVDRLMQAYDFQSVDVIALRPEHPDRVALRNKFLSEHIHTDFEVRFFVDGQGLFYIHAGAKVYGLLCEAGDLISVPDNTPHWFDMGEHPSFKCIRLFTTPEGWVAQYTENPIAARFPSFEQFQRQFA